MLSQSLLRWSVDKGPAPHQLGRLRLLHRWRMESLRYSRDGALFGSAFLGAATLLTGIIWAARDDSGANGLPGTANYRPLDATITLAFGASAATLLGFGIHYLLELKEETDTPHRLYTQRGPMLRAVPTFAIAPSPDGRGGSASFGLVGSFR